MVIDSSRENGLFILMPVMDIGHVPMFVLSERMIMLMGMRLFRMAMCMKFIMIMSVFMDHRHMDMKMSVLFICQQERTGSHQCCRKNQQQRNGILENKEGKHDTRQRSRPVQGACARGPQPTHGINEEHGAKSITNESEHENTQGDHEGWESLP